MKPEPNPLLDNLLLPRRLMALVLLLFLALGGTYAATTPLFEAGDELWHYPLVRHIAQGGAWPVQDADNVGPWKQQASQPPLYYYLMGWATGWIDTSDFAAVYWLNPHVDNGIVTADGNINLALHPAAEGWPWRGTVLAVRLVRLLSVLMGAGTVLLTYQLALTLRPQSPYQAVVAAAVVAFTPMFVFISGAVNNDNLAVLLASAALLVVVRMAARSHPEWLAHHVGYPRGSLSWQWGPVGGHVSPAHWLLGLLVGLAGLTKLSALTIMPVAGLVLAYNEGARWWAQRQRTRPDVMLRHVGVLAVQSGAVFGLAGVICGPWFVRNLRLYGSLTGLNAFIDVLGQRAQPASVAQLWSERGGFMQSYWGLFGGVNLPFADWVYALLNMLAVLSLVGLAIFLFYKWLDERWNRRRWLPVLVTLGYVASVIVALINWATTTWSSQGRLVFAAIAAISTLFTYGLASLVPRRYLWLRRVLLGSVVGLMFGLAAWGALGIIRPAYALPPAADLSTMQHQLNIDFGAGVEPDEMRLLGYSLENDSARPGEVFTLTLYWEALIEMNRNWSVFVHVRDADGIVVAQRDTYPGVGLLATRMMSPGQTVADRYVIELPQATYAPVEAVIEVGLYDRADGFRLPPRDSAENVVRLGTVSIEAISGGLPNPQAVNFEGQLQLLGYEIDRRALMPGEAFTITLYWEGRRRMGVDYTAFVHVRGEGESLWGQLDSWPGDSPTSAWPPGEVVADVREVVVSADTAPGTYDLEVGVYSYHPGGDPEFERLQVIDESGRWLDNFIFLGKIRVVGE